MDFHLDLGVKKVEAEITRRFMSSWRRTLLLQMSRMALRFACMSMRVAMLQEVDDYSQVVPGVLARCDTCGNPIGSFSPVSEGDAVQYCPWPWLVAHFWGLAGLRLRSPNLPYFLLCRLETGASLCKSAATAMAVVQHTFETGTRIAHMFTLRVLEPTELPLEVNLT